MVEGEVEEEETTRGRGEARLALWGEGWAGLDSARAEDAAMGATLWTETRAAAGVSSGGGGRGGGGAPCWHAAIGVRPREAGDG